METSMKELRFENVQLRAAQQVLLAERDDLSGKCANFQRQLQV